MTVSSEDVARRAGVSRSTVSYILNGQGDRFRPATREAVERAVAELGYRPQAAGRTLVRGQSDLVLLVMPIAANGRFGQAIDVLTDALAEHGLSLLMRSATSSLESFTAMITTIRPRAVIALSDLTDGEHAVLRATGVRTLDIARATSQPGAWNWTMGRAQAEHLMHRGYRRITYARLSEARNDVLMHARELGVREACRAAGLAEPETITVALRADADLEAIASLPDSTGVACYNDDTAAAALGAARVLGRRVPQDLGFIGMDDTPVATQTTPRLTTIGVDMDTDMRRLAQTVIQQDDSLDFSGVGEYWLVQGEST
ncbi:LacI family DNA-binding transcriptional regulator [Nonomuraea sp. CA-143628]|uniref:LacI family DNA-binding transcriptional regulator n=1 Tax=Nonomuraea sp. CA-143628 TaxID=3239997 RepID=UPI003D9441FF